MKLCQQFRAPNDRNGNPRRVWRLYTVTGGGFASLVSTVEEGYAGKPSGAGWNYAVEIPPVEVSARVYREILRGGA